MVVAVLFGIYFVLSGWEAGMSLLYLWRPGDSTPSTSNNQPGLNLFTPIWEITNVFLVFGFTGLALLFNNVLIKLSHAVLSTLITGLVALIIRSTLVIYLFYYHGPNKIRPIAGKLFVLASLTVPMSFGLSGIYFISGQPFWRNSLGLSLAGVLLLSILSLALSFAYYFLPSTSSFLSQAKFKMYFISIAYCLSTAVGLQLVINRSGRTSLLGWPYDLFVLLVAAIPLVEIGLYLVSSGRLLWLYFSLLAVTSPALLALSNRPYLIYGRQTIVSAYGAEAYGKWLLIGMVALSPLIILGFILLIWLLITPLRENKKTSN
ncbi:MAG TPA: cytochrome d ubiquinol oxidase subunit II [Candidatus Saccharimonadales bacterium]|nr:cytochrome d ubiquinol oxidase subunit II [Candidatus Saccharimonadales bacterium]